MRVLAYGRRSRTESAADQIERAEAHARRHGHEVLRLAAHIPTSRSRECPRREDLLEACRRKVVDGIALLDLAGLGPDVAATLTELGRAGATVLVVGGDEQPPMELGPQAVIFAGEVARALDRARRLKAEAPRHVCPPRVRVDLAAVRARQAAGARLEEIAVELGVSRSTLVRRLARWRQGLP